MEKYSSDLDRKCIISSSVIKDIKEEFLEKDKEREFKAIEAEKDRHHDTWKNITTNEARLLDSQITHNNTITREQLAAVNEGLRQSMDLADKKTQTIGD